MAVKIRVFGNRAGALLGRRIVNTLMGQLVDGTESLFPRRGVRGSGGAWATGEGLTLSYTHVLKLGTQWGLVLDDEVQTRVATCARLTDTQRSNLQAHIAAAVAWTSAWDDAVDDDDDS